MSVSITYSMRMDVTETLELNVDGASVPAIVHDRLNVKGTLNADSDVPASEHSQLLYNLVGGGKTIDLTALLSTNGRLIDGTGLKIRILRFENKGSAAMTIGKGAANGYDIFGGSAAPAVAADCGVQQTFADSLPAIDATHKTIDIFGTGTEEFAFSVGLG